ncbi:nuclear transport factor 2 family protein [bacterium]|nr:nuclear transport factor 2 family protein [bacterium]
MLKELTQKYIEAFDNKDLEKCAELFTDDFALEDPVVKRIEGKEKVLEAIKGIFDSCETLNFEAKNIYQDNQTTIIEFILKLDDTILTGIDIIEWEDNKMKELRAYLDIPCGDN